MSSLRRSIAARLALGYGVLVAASIVAVSSVFYAGTVGVLARNTDAKIVAISERLRAAYRLGGRARLAREIDRELGDRVDSDTEILILVSARGLALTGNLTLRPEPELALDALVQRDVVRDGRVVPARLIVRLLDDGSRLVVGRDLHELDAIRAVIVHALTMGAAISLLLVLGGALLFRRQIERPIGEIRRTARQIEAGDLSRRIAIVADDEFGRLGGDINRMLDRIEQLMDGVRSVSNAIAHDLRTPLSRIRSRLDEALDQPDALRAGAASAIDDIDSLSLVFEKLLQIAEAESGLLPRNFHQIDLAHIVVDIVELYDAAAEASGITLRADAPASVWIAGDRDLLGSALANLVDNAIKYAGAGATIEVGARADARGAELVVRDDGVGVAPVDLPKLTQRFYRVDRSRALPGNGLGLPIVAAIATLHGARLQLDCAEPGLRARIVLPASPASSSPRAHSA